MSEPLAVLHITDTMQAGGLERVAVNLVNLLPPDRCRAFLCSTRRDGPLLEGLAPHVMRLPLRRRHRFDVQAITKLVNFIREQNIQILHAHGPSLFIAVVAAVFAPFPAVIWHVHSGRLAVGGRSTWPYRLVARRIKGVFAVNQDLAGWACQKLHLPSSKVWYVPNFLSEDHTRKPEENINLPGRDGGRIVCLANLRPLKDHPTLLHAMDLVIRQASYAHLILIGSTSNTVYLESLQKLISKYQLDKHVSLLGHRDDVTSILNSCDIGVLNSISEGFPMTLLEYGMAELPTVATRVGQCPEVLDEGRAGILVQPRSPSQLAEALVELLRSPDRRKYFGKQLNLHVHEKFNQHHVLEKFCHCYESILGEQKDCIPSGL
ncbi:glycosyltransferase family 4 protein [Nitrospira sp. T9]|uniref:glycosyltransferase family 4 protein n=1 Tax=unclassified Nitrospira TaxID=2652172 RepID=UPI003F97B347